MKYKFQFSLRHWFIKLSVFSANQHIHTRTLYTVFHKKIYRNMMVYYKYFTPQICDILQMALTDILHRNLRLDQSGSSWLFSRGNGCVNFLTGESQKLKYVNCTKVLPMCSNLPHFIKKSSRTTFCCIMYGSIFMPNADEINSQNYSYKNMQTVPWKPSQISTAQAFDIVHMNFPTLQPSRR